MIEGGGGEMQGRARLPRNSGKKRGGGPKKGGKRAKKKTSRNSVRKRVKELSGDEY